MISIGAEAFKKKIILPINLWLINKNSMRAFSKLFIWNIYYEFITSV